MQRKEAAVALKRIAREQQLQLEESFASAQRAVLVALNADTPEEREAARAVRKQYVIDQRADRGKIGPIPPPALKQLGVGSAAGREQARETGEQYAVPYVDVSLGVSGGNGTPPPEYSSQRNTPGEVSSSGSFQTPTSAMSSFGNPARGSRSAAVAVSTAEAEVDLLENGVDRVVQLEDSIRLQRLVEEVVLAQRLLAIQAKGQAPVQEAAQRIADERELQMRIANRECKQGRCGEDQQPCTAVAGVTEWRS